MTGASTLAWARLADAAACRPLRSEATYFHGRTSGLEGSARGRELGCIGTEEIMPSPEMIMTGILAATLATGYLGSVWVRRKLRRMKAKRGR